MGSALSGTSRDVVFAETAERRGGVACGASGAGDLRFQLGPTCEQAIDLGLAFLDGGEERRQLGVIAGVLGMLAFDACRAQRRLGAGQRILDRLVLALLLVAELL